MLRTVADLQQFLAGVAGVSEMGLYMRWVWLQIRGIWRFMHDLIAQISLYRSDPSVEDCLSKPARVHKLHRRTDFLLYFQSIK